MGAGISGIPQGIGTAVGDVLSLPTTIIGDILGGGAHRSPSTVGGGRGGAVAPRPPPPPESHMGLYIAAFVLFVLLAIGAYLALR